MTYCRGNPDDYDQWERRGLKGWGWNEISRAFTAIEDHELGCDGVRGEDGPVHISINRYRSPVNAAILEAAKDLGLPVREDVNRPDQEGIGYTPVTIDKGRRVSAATAFLHPARHRLSYDFAVHSGQDAMPGSGGHPVRAEGDGS